LATPAAVSVTVMGLPGLETIYNEIRATAPDAVWPRRKERYSAAGAQAPAEEDWGPVRSASLVYSDGSAVLRTVVIKPDGQSPLAERGPIAFADDELDNDPSSQEEIEDDDEEPQQKRGTRHAPLADAVAASQDHCRAMSRPSHIIEYLVRMYLSLFEKNPNAHELVIAIDYMGYTPKIKSILREYKSQRPIVWPKNAPKSMLFESDLPLQNDVQEIFADNEARRLLFRYISKHLLCKLIHDQTFPRGGFVTIYGAMHSDTDDQCILRAGVSAESGEIFEPYLCEDNDCPKGEADLVLRHLMSRYCNQCDQLLVAPDSDFLPILLHVTNEKFRQGDCCGVSPNTYNIFWQRRVTYTQTIKKAEFIRSLVPPDIKTIPVYKPEYPSMEKKWLEFQQSHTKRPSKEDCVKIRVQKIIEVLDMNRVYTKIWQKLHPMSDGCKLCDPIDVFNLLLYMGGGDYVQKLAFVTFKRLFDVYSTTPKLHARLGGCLCYRSAEAPGRLIISKTSVMRLLSLAYRAINKISLSNVATDNYSDVRAEILRRQLPHATKRVIVPPEDPSGFIANVYWACKYYTRSCNNNSLTQNAQYCFDDPLTVSSDSERLSLFGYRYNIEQERYEFTSRVRKGLYLYY
jgi:hypothetical protein